MLKSIGISSLLALACLLVPSARLAAHHGNTAYDAGNMITLTGTVAEFAWINPHVQIYFDVKDSQGKVTRWSCESPSPGKLGRAGLSRHTLKPGDQITVTIAPAKNGAPVGLMRKLSVNGKVISTEETPD